MAVARSQRPRREGQSADGAGGLGFAGRPAVRADATGLWRQRRSGCTQEAARQQRAGGRPGACTRAGRARPGLVGPRMRISAASSASPSAGPAKSAAAATRVPHARPASEPEAGQAARLHRRDHSPRCATRPPRWPGWLTPGGARPGPHADHQRCRGRLRRRARPAPGAAPALVLGGSADPYYSPDLFRRTAAGIPGGHAVIFPGTGHLHAAASKAAANIAPGFLLAE